MGFGVFVKRAFENGLFRKYDSYFIPFFHVLPEGVIFDAGFVCLVVLVRLDATVIDGQLFKIGYNGGSCKMFSHPA